MKFKNGLAFPDADEYLFDRLPDSGVWQAEAFIEGLQACKNHRTALDGGAHIGTWSLALSEKFTNVIAFEPAPDTFEALTLNTGKTDNITINNQALGQKHDHVKMTWTKKDKRRNHTGARYVKSGGTIKMIPIDYLNLHDLDFLKLDLEGAEPLALFGAVKTLKRCKPVVVFEDKGFCSRFNFGHDASRNILTKLGAVEFKKCGINRVWGWS